MANSKPPLIVIHPLVLISVVDHYNRIMTKTQQPRVVGALLGMDIFLKNFQVKKDQMVLLM